MKHYRIFVTRYIPATNKQGSRVKITDMRFQVSVTLPYDHEFNSIIDQARIYFVSRGIPIAGFGYEEATGHYVLFSPNFDIPLK